MKRLKFLGFVLVACLAFMATLFLGYQAQYGSGQIFRNNEDRLQKDFNSALSIEFSETCLTPQADYRPPWECYEVSVSSLPHDEVVVRHQTEGDEHRVLTFSDQGETKFRFTPNKPGLWRFSTGGELEIQSDRPDYAKGFVAAGENQKWIRTATGEAFVPQYVMYDQTNIDEGLEEFINGHGFTGLHIQNLRDFTQNPSYFEAVVLKTYRLGGVTHFWIWGDKSRKQTPGTYDVDVDELYQEIAARLGPIPGWTFSYGFDLFEWASSEELETFRSLMSDYTTYTHMFGARGYTQRYKEISPNLDYASWEWHRPDYMDYRNHLEQANGRPAFSEDRFRIRTPTRYPEKDYDTDMTRKGLWHSMIAGGVANIWGYKPVDESFSVPYPNKAQIKTYRLFTDKFYTQDLVPDNALIETGYCLSNQQDKAICLAEDTASVNVDIAALTSPISIVAVDTKQGYEEVSLTPSNSTNLQLPYASDWAIALVQ